MDQEKCYELLGLSRAGNPYIEMTVSTLNAAIVQWLYSRMLSSAEGFKALGGIQLGERVFLKIGDNFMFLETELSKNAQSLFNHLNGEGLLHEIVCQPLVDEFNRLTEVELAEQSARDEEKNRNDEIAELKRLMAIHKDSGLF